MALSEFSIESPKICYICYFLTHANPCKLSGRNATNVSNPEGRFDLYTALCWPALWAAAILVSVSFHGKCSVLASVASLACVASYQQLE